MISFILRRVFIAIPLLLVVSFIVFFLSRTGGRDPVDAILGEKGKPEVRARVTRELGLDRPLIVQYGIYIGRVLRGDFGTSYIMQGQSVSGQVARHWPVRRPSIRTKFVTASRSYAGPMFPLTGSTPEKARVRRSSSQNTGIETPRSDTVMSA